LTDIALRPAVRALPSRDLLFAAVAFASASLVFVVEPMVARLVLPLLGGSPAVWNTSLAFFQLALLVGYVYAHLLQRFRSVRWQVAVHMGVLALAALTLPLRISTWLGDPPPGAPALWLVGVLALSIGAPFAALSATAPLIQAWFVRAGPRDSAGEPYALYAASNLGSLAALIAYPVLVEPNLTLAAQRSGWTWGYAGFVLLAALLGATLWPAARAAAPVAATRAAPASWRERLAWLALAAIPSSLMLGVTNYVTVDLGSAPFLWVAPLALYLVSFVVAFQTRPAIPPGLALTLQAGAVAFASIYLRAWALGFLPVLAIHLSAFFLTALVCHQALVARRPPPERLTEFYIWMSLGGVVGGLFNAFLAPVLFSQVIEYPAVLVIACLVRPWGRGPLQAWRLGLTLLAATAALMAIGVSGVAGPLHRLLAPVAALAPSTVLVPILLAAGAIAALLLRGRALPFTAAVLSLIVAAWHVSEPAGVETTARSFFGVLSTGRAFDTRLGPVRIMTHGTTLHGAQQIQGPYHCRPLVYYAPEAPIGQVFAAEMARKPALSMGVVGLGAGSVAAYTRPGDTLRFFEIDPLVVRAAQTSFGYVGECAHGQIRYTVGDARLSLARMPAGAFDVLLIDAFSSDSVPAHLLTVEAARLYLDKLKPGGVVILHLSNRNLDLLRPAQAIALAAGAEGFAQSYHAPPGRGAYWAATEDAVVFARTRAALAPFEADRRWTKADPEGVRPWTDDYTNLFGALVRRIKAGQAG
jgi:predicted O-methyltransferase YrrM